MSRKNNKNALFCLDLPSLPPILPLIRHLSGLILVADPLFRGLLAGPDLEQGRPANNSGRPAQLSIPCLGFQVNRDYGSGVARVPVYSHQSAGQEWAHGWV